ATNKTRPAQVEQSDVLERAIGKFCDGPSQFWSGRRPGSETDLGSLVMVMRLYTPVHRLSSTEATYLPRTRRARAAFKHRAWQCSWCCAQRNPSGRNCGAAATFS